MDGTLSFFDNQYSNDVDRMDARKMFNPGENWGMVRNDLVLVVERRQDVVKKDTIFFKFWNTRVITYRAEFIGQNFAESSVSALLVDKYLNTMTPVSLTQKSHVDFQITNDPNSSRSDRFMLVFNAAPDAGALPINFVKSDAVYSNKVVSIHWETANEDNVKEYTVEKSSDGTRFENTSMTIAAKNVAAGSYNATDENPMAGANYYRIKATDIDGRMAFSSVMKVQATSVETNIAVFPNPASASNIHLRFRGQKQGTYKIHILNIAGNVIHTQQEILTNAGTDVRVVPNRNLPQGIYKIEVNGPDGYHNALNLLIRY